MNHTGPKGGTMDPHGTKDFSCKFSTLAEFLAPHGGKKRYKMGLN